MLVLGIDVGTTGTKVLLVDEKGRVVGDGYKGYGTVRAAGGIVEQNAEDWWNAVQVATKQAVASVDVSQIEALSLSTQGASSLVINSLGDPLCAAITWMDSRAINQKERQEKTIGSDWFYRKTGWPLNVSLDACKALWVHENCPELLAEGNLFVSTQEYIHFKLLGKAIIDPSNAAMRQMMNLATKQWDEEILGQVGITKQSLPTILPAGQCLGTILPKAAKELGIPETVKVLNGGHDQYCCSVGSGTIAIGEAFLGTGTAWALMANTQKPMITASKVSPGPHIIANQWGALSTVPCAGVAFDWVKDTMVQCDYKTIDEQVLQRLGKSESLFFYPYFTGVGCPDWENFPRGSIVGLELHHDAIDMAMTVMEGIAFQASILIDEYRNNGVEVSKLKVMGGAGKSLPWMQIVAAATGCDVELVEVADAAPMGAAVIAAVGVGMFDSYEQAASILAKSTLVPHPAQDVVQAYQYKKNEYKKRWQTIKTVY